jgi:predicted alpha/beta hydrolase family esterase
MKILPYKLVCFAVLLLISWQAPPPVAAQPSLIDHEFPLDTVTVNEKRARVFIVHGTFDGNSNWPLIVAGKTSFASEVKRALPAGSTVHQFLWSGKNNHEARKTAAKFLASEISEYSSQGENIAIIGHSHGGNVALLAASQLKDPINTVICLSTPHLYLVLEDAENKEVELPVYCPPANQELIRHIVTLSPSSDNVPGFWAEINGINDDEGLAMTRPWRKAQQLILPNVSGPFQDLAERIGLSDEVVNLESRDHLSVTPYNFKYRCDVEGIKKAHRVVHSARMGYILGSVIQHGMSKPVAQYLSTIYQFEKTDDGSITDSDLIASSRAKYYEGFDRPRYGVALRMKEVKIVALENVPALGEREPDLYFRIKNAEGKQLFESSEADDGLEALWVAKDLTKLLPGIARGWIEVWDDDFNGDDPVGQPVEFQLEFGLDAYEIITVVTHPEFTATITWQKLHE